MTSVVIVGEAETQLREIDSWWREHRDVAQSLVTDEFERCVFLLQNSPDIGTRFHRTEIPGVRRILMKKTRHLVYYIHDPKHELVYIVAVWGMPKDGDPPLQDPR